MNKAIILASEEDCFIGVGVENNGEDQNAGLALHYDNEGVIELVISVKDKKISALMSPKKLEHLIDGLLTFVAEARATAKANDEA